MTYVENGARFLDVVAPGWWKSIKLRKLDMAHDENCILGQLWGNYFNGLAGLGLSDDGRRFGFDGPDSTALVAAWKVQVLNRKFAS